MKFVLLCCLVAAAQPPQQPPSKADPKHISCWKILPYVWAYGEDAAVAWARGNGYSDAQITEMRRRCSKV